MAPPPRAGEWDVRFATNAAARDWEELGNKAPGNTADAWSLMRENPCPTEHGQRHHQLKGTLAREQHGGQVYDQWQIEVTGSGRIWYLVDRSRQTIWVTYASLRHPKATE
ncbi:hypothetical protein [Kutzneria sp. NPDC052558]|uniref:hypothetical protein n=1 Tax=Kutzneria sp. NPDC052558 TaxID=3364121 RepID=UPI0037C73EB6